MLKIVTALSFAVLAATPSFAAGEARVEAHGGIGFASGGSEAFLGVAAGYDFDLDKTAFIGAEASADKFLVAGSNVLWSLGARVGAKIGAGGKVYANGGVAFCCGSSDAYLGAGYQQKFSSNVYAKIEYRRTLTSGAGVNFVGVGVGAAF